MLWSARDLLYRHSSRYIPTIQIKRCILLKIPPSNTIFQIIFFYFRRHRSYPLHTKRTDNAGWGFAQRIERHISHSIDRLLIANQKYIEGSPKEQTDKLWTSDGIHWINWFYYLIIISVEVHAVKEVLGEHEKLLQKKTDISQGNKRI